VLLQYFQFLRLGFDGYRRVQQTCQDVCLHISAAVSAMDQLQLVSDGSDLPVFAFRLDDSISTYTAYGLSRKLREAG